MNNTSVSRQRTSVPALTASSMWPCIRTTACQPSPPSGRTFGGRSTSHSYSWSAHPLVSHLISPAVLSYTCV